MQKCKLQVKPRDNKVHLNICWENLDGDVCATLALGGHAGWVRFFAAALRLLGCGPRLRGE